ncbi:MAG: phage tail tube protein [Muribaculaceae bacterium]|nr:phage tail tube protein [Muribaculaceae bacterium]
MAGNTAEQTLKATNARVFLAGEEVGFWQSFSATITINYEDVYVGDDVDRREVSKQGDGNLSQQLSNSIGVELFNKIKAGGRHSRFTIEAEIEKDATGETQIMTIPGVTFDAIPLADWEKGAVAKADMSFRFPPSQVVFSQTIS